MMFRPRRGNHHLRLLTWRISSRAQRIEMNPRDRFLWSALPKTSTRPSARQRAWPPSSKVSADGERGAGSGTSRNDSLAARRTAIRLSVLHRCTPDAPGARPHLSAADKGLIRVSPVGLAGIEPATSALSVLRSNRLSYSPADLPGYTTGRGLLDRAGGALAGCDQGIPA